MIPIQYGNIFLLFESPAKSNKPQDFLIYLLFIIRYLDCENILYVISTVTNCPAPKILY